MILLSVQIKVTCSEEGITCILIVGGRCEVGGDPSKKMALQLDSEDNNTLKHSHAQEERHLGQIKIKQLLLFTPQHRTGWKACSRCLIR